MGMNIKNDDVHALARDLASQEHTSVTRAVAIALQEALDRRHAGAGIEERHARVNAVLDRMRTQLRESSGPSLHEISDTLYDERGLPT